MLWRSIFVWHLTLVFDGSCRVAPTDDALPGVGIGHMLGTFSHTLLFTHDQSPVEVGNKRINEWGLGFWIHVIKIQWISWFKMMTYHMGVSKNKGTPKWMVYNGKPY